MGNIKNEKHMLLKLNKKKIGPKLVLFLDPNILIYEFVAGVFLRDFIEQSSKQKVRAVFKEVLRQCFVLDQMGINKEEMHRPHKHVIVGKDIVMIDFERARQVEVPQNVTQFSTYVGSIFREKSQKLRILAAEYKQNQTKQNYTKILNYI